MLNHLNRINMEYVSVARWKSDSKLSNLETDLVISILNGHDSDVNSVAISSDGKTIFSGSDDNTIKVWNLYFDWLIERNCDHIRVYLANPNADLSDEERKLCDGIGEEK